MSSSSSSSSAAAAAAAATPAFNPEAFRQVHPREYLRKFVQQGVRPDGRGLTRIRKTTVVVGSVATAAGSALVRCGHTSVLCGIKAEIAEPTIAKPRDGFLVPNVDLTPMSSSKFRPGPPNDAAQAMSQRLQDTLVGLPAGPWPLDLEELCVEDGKAVWVLYADIVCLNYDGSVFDTALVALCAALKNLKLPSATYDADKRQVFADGSKTHGISLGYIPVATTFGFFDGAILADPSDQEESVADSALTVISTADEKILALAQTGTTPLSQAALNGALIVAATRAKEVTELVNSQ